MPSQTVERRNIPSMSLSDSITGLIAAISAAVTE
jgi:pyrrolidone-carboxylate peptidase